MLPQLIKKIYFKNLLKNITEIKNSIAEFENKVEETSKRVELKDREEKKVRKHEK